MRLMVARRIWPRRTRRAIQWILLLAVIFVCVYGALKLREIIEF